MTAPDPITILLILSLYLSYIDPLNSTQFNSVCFTLIIQIAHDNTKSYAAEIASAVNIAVALDKVTVAHTAELHSAYGNGSPGLSVIVGPVYAHFIICGRSAPDVDSVG